MSFWLKTVCFGEIISKCPCTLRFKSFLHFREFCLFFFLFNQRLYLPNPCVQVKKALKQKDKRKKGQKDLTLKTYFAHRSSSSKQKRKKKCFCITFLRFQTTSVFGSVALTIFGLVRTGIMQEHLQVIHKVIEF